MKDELTGNPYVCEHARYVRLYDLTGTQATAVLLCEDESERSEACFRFIDINARVR
jgi:hypothetical protein